MYRFNVARLVRISGVVGALVLGAALVPAGPARAANAMWVDTTADELVTDGACSLREAINTAGSNANYPDCGKGAADDFDTIFLQAGATYDLAKVTPANLDNQGGDLDIIDNPAPIDLYIVGNPLNPPTVRAKFAAGSESRVFEVAAGATVYLQYFGVTGGKIASIADNRGGGIRNHGDLTLTDVAVSGNHAGQGGGIANEPGAVLTLDSADVHHNVSQSSGGGIQNEAGTLVVEGGSLIRSNQAVYGGGGIASTGQNDKPALATIRETSLVLGNKADGVDGDGGGVFNNAGSGLLIEDSTIAQNTATAEGGGIYSAEGGSLIIKGSSVGHNVARSGGKAGPAGGGLANYATASVRTSSIDNNATGNAEGNTGGGIYNIGNLTVDRSALYSNSTVGQYGGAIYTNGALKLINSTLNKNIGTFAVYAAATTVEIHNSTIVGNTGGLGLDFNPVGSIVSRSIIAGNNVSEDCLADNAPVSKGYNILGETCNAFDVATDEVGVDPKLLALDDNGGPTKTNAPAGGSPAIDIIPKAVCAVVDYESQKTDQRGTARPNGLGCDAGAYEHALVLANPAPAPTITKLLPKSAAVGAGELLLTVSGTSFSNTSEVRWNGAPRDTTFVSAATLTVLVPAEDLATAGEHTVTVYTPAPGGGTSNSAAFSVKPDDKAPPPPAAPVKHTIFTPMVGR